MSTTETNIGTIQASFGPLPIHNSVLDNVTFDYNLKSNQYTITLVRRISPTTLELCQYEVKNKVFNIHVFEMSG